MSIYRIAHFSGTPFEVERNMNKFLEEKVNLLEQIHINPLIITNGIFEVNGYIVYEPKEDEF